MTDSRDASAESFADLLERVRTGDQDAATELAKKYEPAIRRVVRFRMGDSRLQSAFDSADVCQSVMASFFVRAASGQFDLESPEQLMQLLTTMAKRKLGMQIRKQRASKRDQRRVVSSPSDEHALPGADSTPSQVIAAKELVGEAHRRMSDDERRIVDWRKEGMEWSEIAERLDISAEAARKKLARALDRVTEELGLDA